MIVSTTAKTITTEASTIALYIQCSNPSQHNHHLVCFFHFPPKLFSFNFSTLKVRKKPHLLHQNPSLALISETWNTTRRLSACREPPAPVTKTPERSSLQTVITTTTSPLDLPTPETQRISPGSSSSAGTHPPHQLTITLTTASQGRPPLRARSPPSSGHFSAFSPSLQ